MSEERKARFDKRVHNANYHAANRDRLLADMAVYRAVHQQERRTKDAAYRDANKQRVHAQQAAWRTANPAKLLAGFKLRQTRKAQRCPTWADLDAITEVYESARRVTQETGVAHVVDHIIPLAGRLVCGLHVAANLRVITHAENASKHDRFEPITEVYGFAFAGRRSTASTLTSPSSIMATGIV